MDIKELLAFLAVVVTVISAIVLVARKRRQRREARSGPPRAAATVATAPRPAPQPPAIPAIQVRDFNPTSHLVTKPGECQWDHKLAERAAPPTRFDAYGLPAIFTPDELWRFLGLSGYRNLVHLADAERLNSYAARIANYWIRDIPKRGGGWRRLHAPKPRLKQVQRRILRDILEKVPVHPAATAFRRGSDVARNAARHVGKQIVLCYDLQDFFPTIRRRRVAAFFQWLGYHPKVARILSLLCCVHDSGRGRVLPQGAPTSPALANAICFRMDCRLAGLARRFGVDYTRYADDLTFSGDETFKRGLSRFIPLVEKIIRAEGFHINTDKRRFMRRGHRQRVTGLVVNERVGLARDEYDRLKAILHNGQKAGSLESQNREKRDDFAAHLRGRIAWLARFHPERAAKLRQRLEALA